MICFFVYFPLSSYYYVVNYYKGRNMMKESKTISIYTEYITLGQLLKLADVIFEGGEAKAYLASNKVYVNGEEDERRGRKVRPGDEVELPNLIIKVEQQ